MKPPYTVAASVVPSAEEAIPLQSCVSALSDQVLPLSLEVKINPLLTVAANLVPSAEEAIDIQFLVGPLGIQVLPLSLEV